MKQSAKIQWVYLKKYEIIFYAKPFQTSVFKITQARFQNRTRNPQGNRGYIFHAYKSMKTYFCAQHKITLTQHDINRFNRIARSVDAIC